MPNTATAETPTHKATDLGVATYVREHAAQWAARGIALRRHAPATFTAGPIAWQSHVWVGRTADADRDKSVRWPAVVAVRCYRSTGRVDVSWAPRPRIDEGRAPCAVPSGMALVLDQIAAAVQEAIGATSIRDHAVAPETAYERRREAQRAAQAEADRAMADLTDLFGG